MVIEYGACAWGGDVYYPLPVVGCSPGNAGALPVVMDMRGGAQPALNMGGPLPLPRPRPRACLPRLPKLVCPNWLGTNGAGG